MSVCRICWLLAISVLVGVCAVARGEEISAPEPQRGSISGTVTDLDEAMIPGATVELIGPAASDHKTLVADQTGDFEFAGVRPAVPYHVTVRMNGFATWTSPAIVLTPGQFFELKDVKLMVAAVETSVNAASSEEIATEQVKEEEQQRVFGIVPNFYIAYGTQFVPLTTGLKYKLALRTSTDVVTFASAVVLGAMNQAADTPSYVQGMKGYGQRVGAAYAGAAADVMIGGAILPSLLHQDPRYFYQGTGTKKSRIFHAMQSPFLCKGDDGRLEFNYSSIGGDLATGALQEIYYPPHDRGPGLVFSSALLTTGGRIANALAQEFILGKYTSRGKPKN